MFAGLSQLSTDPGSPELVKAMMLCHAPLLQAIEAIGVNRVRLGGMRYASPTSLCLRLFGPP